MQAFLEEKFHLKENGTTVSTEVMAGLSTFFAMSYIIFVNPSILSQAGMPYEGVFLATILAAGIATLFMGLYANVPYALASGMGLNAFFTYTVVLNLGFTWQEALAMVFICGLLNIVMTITSLRRQIIKAIPDDLQAAISGGIGVFIAYIGIKNAGFVQFSADSGAITSINNAPYDPAQTVYENGITAFSSSGGTLPSITTFTEPMTLLAVFALLLTIILLVKKVRGAVLIGILTTTVAYVVLNPDLLSSLGSGNAGLGESFGQFGEVFGAALGSQGLGSLFSDPARIPLVLVTIFAFSLADVFDTIGMFIGSGRQSGIFSKDDVNSINETGKQSKLDKALFGDVVGTSLGAVLGTSNTTVFAESQVGISNGGRTGLTSVVTAIAMFLCIFIAPFVSLVPTAATAPALIIVGIMMMASFTEVDWNNLAIAIPAFFASIFMGYSYSVANGIAVGFILYCLTMTVTGRSKDVHPILWGASGLFILNFVVMAFI